ncbi:MAG: hypothetical protein ACP5T9_05770 [Thermoplasmata archaeon]
MNLAIYKNEYFVIKRYRDGIGIQYEYRINGKPTHKKLIGLVKGWRKDMFLKALSYFRVKEEEDEFERMVRIKLYIQLLPTIEDRVFAYNLINFLDEMPFEELTFWNWKFTQMRKDAIRGFKAMYRDLLEA